MIICGCAAREVIILILCLIGVSAKKTSAISSLIRGQSSHSSNWVPTIEPEPQIGLGESAFGIPKEAKRQNSLRLFGRIPVEVELDPPLIRLHLVERDRRARF